MVGRTILTAKDVSLIDYNIGDIVYLRLDDTQSAFFIIGIIIRPEGVLYELNGPYETTRNGFEISKEKDILKTL